MDEVVEAFEGDGEGVRMPFFSSGGEDGRRSPPAAGLDDEVAPMAPAFEIADELVLGVVFPFAVWAFNRFSSSVIREIRLEVFQVV